MFLEREECLAVGSSYVTVFVSNCIYHYARITLRSTDTLISTESCPPCLDLSMSITYWQSIPYALCGNFLKSKTVVSGGVILTTMCMDVVGRMYLKEIHYLGRKLKSNNPFYLIREAKARYVMHCF